MKPVSPAVAALALGLSGAVTFTLCVLWDLAVPSLSMVRGWELILPGFRAISLGSYVLGLVETFLYGAYAGALFASLYDVLSRRLGGAAGDKEMKHA